MTEHKRHPCELVIHALSMIEKSVVSNGLPVIRCDDQQGLVEQSRALELINESSYVMVNVLQRSVVKDSVVPVTFRQVCGLSLSEVCEGVQLQA